MGGGGLVASHRGFSLRCNISYLAKEKQIPPKLKLIVFYLLQWVKERGKVCAAPENVTGTCCCGQVVTPAAPFNRSLRRHLTAMRRPINTWAASQGRTRTRGAARLQVAFRSHRHAILFLNILVSIYQPWGLTLDGTIMLLFFVQKMATSLTEMAT